MSEEVRKPLYEIGILSAEEYPISLSNLPQMDVHGRVKNLIPWRKPEERPEDSRECLVLEKDGTKWFRFYYARDDGFETENGGYCRRIDVKAWCYADEIPLPPWVQK